MERNNWSISIQILCYRRGDPTVFLRLQNNTRSLMINGNSIFNQKMTVIAQLNIKQTINHITCCSVKAIHKLWIWYFNTILEFTKLRSSAFRRFFQRVTIHVHTVAFRYEFMDFAEWWKRLTVAVFRHPHLVHHQFTLSGARVGRWRWY